ncbi:MAG: hypothetical protein JXQ77_02705 [Campylobacterales bacterium]|nr:hypothetical protein [Campylobacterales bacterium]
MTQRDMAIYLDIDVKTIRNWRKNRPNLYKTIMLGLMVDDVIEKSEKNIMELKELKQKFEKLDDAEK